MIVDYLQRSMSKYCEVEKLRMAEYEKIRADVIRRMGKEHLYKSLFYCIMIANGCNSSKWVLQIRMRHSSGYDNPLVQILSPIPKHKGNPF